MSNKANSEQGMQHLLGDALASNEVSDTLLLQYSEAPETLSETERQEVEQALAASPALADQLRVLQQFTLPSQLTEHSTPPVTQKTDWWQTLRAAFDTWFGMPYALAGAAAAVTLAVFVFWQTGTPQDHPQIVKEENTPPEVEHPPVAPPEETLEQIASSSTTTAPAPAPLEQLSQINAQPSPQTPVPAPLPAPAPTAEPDKSSLIANETHTPPETAPATQAPIQNELGDLRFLVAFAEPSYQSRYSDEQNEMVVRGDAVSLRLLAPDIAATLQSQPTLFWQIAPSVAHASMLLEIIDLETDTLVLEQELLPEEQAPATMQRLALSDYTVTLEPGKTYEWNILLQVDKNNPALDQIASARLRVEPPSQSLQQALTQADPSQRFSLLTEHGYWYDALAELIRLRQEHAATPSLENAYQQLLQQGGIKPL